MSAALDTLSAEESALFKEMEAADAGLPPEPLRERPEPATEQEAADPVVAKDPAEPKLVDKRALDEERTKRKKAEKDLNDHRVKSAEEQARVTTRLEMLAQAAEAHLKQPPAAPVAEAPAPAFDADPKAFIEHKFKELDRRQAELDRRTQEFSQFTSQTTQQQREAQAVNELEGWAMGQEQEFASATPDYQAAVQFLAEARTKQLRRIGVDNPVEIRNAIAQDVRGLALMARQKGRQFGEVLYGLAQDNGYKPGTAQVAAASPAASARVADVDSAAERLIRGQDMATTLGSTGAAARGDPAAAVIANMDDVAFAKLLKSVEGKGPAAMRQLFGG